MSGRPRRAAAETAKANMSQLSGDDDEDSPVAPRRGKRVLDDSMEDDDGDEDAAPPRAPRADFVRRSSRAAKPVARLSPGWKEAFSDEDEEEPEPDSEPEYEEESETSEPDPDDDDDLVPAARQGERYSRRQRNTIERYSPKPNERGLAGGGAGSESPRPRGGGRSDVRGARRGGGNGSARRDRDRDGNGGRSDRRARGGGHRWMDDTDDSDADAPGEDTFPGFGGGFGGRAPDLPYPLVKPDALLSGGFPGGDPSRASTRPGGGGDGAGPGGEAAGAEITPLAVDPSLTFDQVGGLASYVHSLKEMVFLPLLYPEVFARFKMAPPRGVLLYGAPGTGKTLIARALAASCSRAGAEVSFYMRKGADVLSKWVGESERQLRLLFAEAQKRQPSIIFFDEIDGLAPVRSSKTDQIHNSIVATLLALMDGLDSRGRVVVLGATNRVDAVDGALRRPGRFDRELAFPLPSVSARAEILRIHTRAWEKKPSDEILDQLAQKCVGYCGADLKALCTEAAVHALRRRYPQIYESDDKLLIDPGRVVPNRADFRAAMDAITPASHRSAQAHARPLGPLRAPLLGPTLDELVEATKTAFPPFALAATANDEGDGGGGGDGDGGVFGLSPEDSDSDSEDDDAILRELGGGSLDVPGAALAASPRATGVGAKGGGSRSLGSSASAALAAAALEFVDRPLARPPRLLLAGAPGAGQTPLGAALLHELEAFPVHAVGLPSLLADGGRTPEEALVGAVTEARRAAPAILFLPHLRLWWDSAPPSLRAVLRALLEDVPGDLPLMLLATCDCEREALDEDAAGLFGEDQVVELRPPSAPARRAYLGAVVTAAARAARGSDLKAADASRGGGGGGDGKKARRRTRAAEVLEKAPAHTADASEAARVGAPDLAVSDSATASMLAAEDHALRQQRMFLRDVVTRLLYRDQWSEFHVPVAEEEAPGYAKAVKEPMDLSTLLWRVDSGWYLTVEAFLRDVRLIVAAAKTYWGGGPGEEGDGENGKKNPRAGDPEGQRVVSRAHALEDTVHEMAGQLDPGLVQKCAAIARHRAARAEAERKAQGEPTRGTARPEPAVEPERRSARRGGGEESAPEAAPEATEGGPAGAPGAGGSKRSREFHAQAGYVADPEALAREARRKRQREEATARRAEAETEAEAAAKANAEAAAKAAAEAEEAMASAAREAAATEMKAAAAEMKAKEPEEQPSEPSAMDAAPIASAPIARADANAPTPPTDAELAAACGNVADALVAATKGFSVADAEAAAAGLGRAAKDAAEGARPGYRCGATIAAMAAFAKGLGK